MSLQSPPSRTWRTIPAIALAVLVGASALAAAPSAEAATKASAKKGCALKKKAKCKKAKLTKVKVGKVNLSGTDLRGAVITGATFSGTNLSGVDMAGARITNTTFRNVNVARLNLSRATLRNVTFIGAGGVAKAAQAREAECKTVESAGSLYTLECTPGGVSMRGAILITDTGNAGVVFRKSNIPRSDFRGITRSDARHVAVVGFTDGTDVSASFLGPAATLRDAVFEFDRATARGAVMDGAWFTVFDQTDATDSTMLGMRLISGGPDIRGRRNQLQGVRGLDGVATVTIVGPSGVSPPGLRTVQVREDGLFRPGILCEALPCVRQGVAVGAPAVATAMGTEPLVMSIPGWTCSAPAPTTTDGVQVYRTTCSIRSLPAGNVSGSLAREPVPMVAVTATADSGVPATATAITRLSFVVTPPGGGASDTTTCAAASTCTREVIPGSTVSVRAYDATRVVVAQCPGATEARLTSPVTEFACPGQTVSTALPVRFVVRPAVAMNVRAVDALDTSVATPIATLRWWVRPPGLDVAATITCDGQATCDNLLPLGAAARLTIGDPLLDTSGFCPGPPTSPAFFFRMPGTVSTCPEFTLTTAENFIIQTEA